MKVLHINASDRGGGAALAAWRLHQGLRKLNVDSHLLVRNKYSDDNSVAAITNTNLNSAEEEFCNEIIQRVYYHNRTEISNTHFSLPLEGIDLTEHPLVRDADVIHLHWVASFQTPKTILALLEMNKPIIWTLHDLAPFTGGCHFSAGCNKFQTACDACPQYLSDPFDIPNLVLQSKKTLWSGHAISIIAPSHWMAERAKESALFSSMPISVIPNAVDIKQFHLLPQASARSLLGIAEDGQYILCGADQSREKRKGFVPLRRILTECFDNPALKNTKILWVGDKPLDSLFDGLPLIFLGRLKEEQMTLAYAAADIFVFPSLEDNLPNMVLEALSCGKPAIAFDIGGIGEIIKNDHQGYLSPLEDEQSMIQNIIFLLSAPAKRQSMSAHCRMLIEENFKDNLIAERHLALYQSVLEKKEVKRQEVECQANIATQHNADLEQLQPKLMLHCLATEIKNLQTELQVLQVDHRARLEDIRQLHIQNHDLFQMLKTQSRFSIKKLVIFLYNKCF